jgi:hypothetical protein
MIGVSTADFIWQVACKFQEISVEAEEERSEQCKSEKQPEEHSEQENYNRVSLET